MGKQWSHWLVSWYNPNIDIVSFIPIGIHRYCYADVCRVQRHLSWRNTQSVPLEGWFQYEKANSHCGDKIIFPLSYPHNGVYHNAMLVKQNLCGSGPLLTPFPSKTQWSRFRYSQSTIVRNTKTSPINKNYETISEWWTVAYFIRRS